MSRAQLVARLNQSERRRKFAWAKYFNEARSSNTLYVQQYEKIMVMPEHVKTEMKEMIEELRKHIECPICLDVIKTDDMQITNCGHKFHASCLKEAIAISAPKCPTCRREIR